MSESYRFDHRTSRHRKRQFAIVLMCSVFVIAIVAIVLLYLVNETTKSKPVVGPTRIVAQAPTEYTTQPTTTYNSTDYSIAIPVGWKIIPLVPSEANADTEYSVNWQSSGTDGGARFLSIYEDNIPSTYALNLVLPVAAQGNKILYGMISNACEDFTEGSTAAPIASKWQSVNFLCNLPDQADDQVGTGSVGSPINTITVTGPTEGTHTYFFVYTDRSAEFDYTIFQTILSSFRAK